MPTVPPQTPLEDLPWIAPKTRKALLAAGFATAADLVDHIPRRYEDRSRFDAYPQDASDTPVCVAGNIVDTSLRRLGGRRQFFEATLEDTGSAFSLGATVTCRWFNMAWIHKVLATGQKIVVYGKPKISGKRIVIDHPDYEIIDPDTDPEHIHTARITPVYPLKEGLRQRSIREAIYHTTQNLDWPAITDILRQPSGESVFAGLSRSAALRSVHFPDSFETLDRSRRYLALEEFFVMQLNVLQRKRAYASQPGACHCGPGDLLGHFLADLPFQPTRAQHRSIGEIRQDLTAPRPMNRLLQGDVGSGKTLVAAAAILLAVEAGYQAALMAPTQILAEQHFLNFQRWLAPLDITVALRTGGKASKDPEADANLALFSETREKPQVVVGTHALLYDKAASTFDNLGLVVVDEQHKFGVAQRARLAARGTLPDVLVMTATPIPRTLTMTVYGDLDVSVLDELPAGRQKIVTAVRPGAKPADVAKFLRTHLDQGRQAYVVYPLIDESETLSAKAATTEFEAWQKRLAPHFEVDLLHGRLPALEKDAVMDRFRRGHTDVLVSTTVVEVGVDVPNASVMLIYSAERFGLAQLHQLRGRVGRGAHKSYCILVPDPKKADATDRLDVLATTSDGFVVAEEDLKLRGPGDLLGTAQSGVPGFRFGDLLLDTALVRTARNLAAETFAADPDLTAPTHRHLRPLITSSPLPNTA